MTKWIDIQWFSPGDYGGSVPTGGTQVLSEGDGTPTSSAQTGSSTTPVISLVVSKQILWETGADMLTEDSQVLALEE